MVPIPRYRIIQQFLQQPVHMSGGKQVLPANDVSHLLERVIVDTGEVIAGANVLPCKDYIPHGLRPRRNFTSLRALTFLDEAKFIPAPSKHFTATCQ